MGATQETVAEYAAKHGVNEEAVRDIAGLPPKEAIEASVKADAKNPAIIKVKVKGYDGPVIVDWGDRGSAFTEEDVKGLEHRYLVPGAHRVRLDLGGEVIWLDVEAGVDPDPEPVEAPEVPALIGAPPLPGQVSVEDAIAEAEAGQDGSGSAEGSQGPQDGSEVAQGDDTGSSDAGDGQPQA